jgi:hypothetical protein
MATSNGFQVSGKIAEIHPEKQFGKLTKQDFVIDFNDGKYDQTLRFEVLGDRVSQLEDLEAGDEVTVHFNVRGHRNKSTGVVYNNLTAWRIDTGVPKQKQRHQKPLPQKSRGPQPAGDWSPGRGDEDEIEF